MPPITTHHNTGGNRDYLDGKPIHAGDLIDLYDDGIWVPGRYELWQGVGVFIWPEGDMERWLRIQPGMVFRWSQ